MKRLIYILRHGETALNKQKIVQGSGIDSSLNDHGLAQANAFYQAYKNENFDFVFTSGLKRTQQTVHQFLLDGIPYQVFEELNEISWGPHEGKLPNDESLQDFNRIVADWKNGDYDSKVPGAESAQELNKRMQNFVSHFNKTEFKKTLICTHGRALRCLLTVLNEEPLKDMDKYRHHNTGLYIFEQENGKYNKLVHNDTTHLTNANLNVIDWS